MRTRHFAGEAMFQFLVATTNNLLRWMKHSTFKGTVLEQMGVGRLIHQGMQIPARVRKWGEKWIIEMPAQHTLVKQLLKSWNEISLAEVRREKPGLFAQNLGSTGALGVYSDCL